MEQSQKQKKENKEYVKQFVTRNSLLVDLFENKHVRTVYHMFMATFVGLFINTAVYDFLKNEEMVLGLKLIKLGFAKVHISFLLWIGYFIGICFVYFCFNIWAKYRNSFHKLELVKLWDFLWIIMLSGYYIFSFQSSYNLVSHFKLPPASAAIVTIEQTRMLMKVHSFIRENAPKVLRHKPHGDSELSLPIFSYFLYFLFVPTLLYRDSYPRTEKIRWNFVFFRIVEIISVLFFYSFVIDRFLNPSVRDFGLRKYTLNEIILCLFENTSSGILILLPSFFLILHSWQNLFAELTRFGDRLFYSDWWTCTDYSGYFRKWNIIVQEWLYCYIYKDSKQVLFKNSPTMPKIAVFLISAIVHEWIMTSMFGFFFPLLFIEFVVFGSILNSIGGPKTSLFNVLFWYSLSLGMSTLVTMYAIEYYARLNSTIEDNSWCDFLIPRFLTCDCIDYS